MDGKVSRIENGIVFVQNDWREYSTPYVPNQHQSLAQNDLVTFDVVKDKFGVDSAGNIKKKG